MKEQILITVPIAPVNEVLAILEGWKMGGWLVVTHLPCPDGTIVVLERLQRVPSYIPVNL